MNAQIQELAQKVLNDGIVFGPIFQDFATADQFYKQLPYYDVKTNSLRPKTHVYVLPRLFIENENWTVVVTGGALSIKEKEKVMELWKKFKTLDGSFIAGE
jgi:hypothetical protein